MSRRGFALLAVLWTIAVLGMLVAGSLRLAANGAGASHNRITLTRAGWAREACLEILLSRFARDISVRLVDTTDLGRNTWCRAELEDIGARLNLNHASADALRKLIGTDSLADALLDWRDPDDVARPVGAESDWYQRMGRLPPRNGPLADVAELALVRGFDPAQLRRLSTLLTVEGDGRVNLNAAPPEVLGTLPGLDPDAAVAIAGLRITGGRIEGADYLASLLPPSAQLALLENYQEFTRSVIYSPLRFVALVEGGVRGKNPLSRAMITLVPAAGRLAVVRRRTE